MEANGPSTLYLAVIAAFIFTLFDLDQKISWKWLLAGVVASAILMMVVPAFRLSSWFNTLIGIFELFSMGAIYTGLGQRIKKKWLAFILAIILALIASTLLSILVGYLYNI